MMKRKQVVLQLQMIRNSIAAAGFCLALNWAASVQAGQPANEIKQVVVQTDGNSCSIRMADPYGGRLTETGYDLIGLPYRKTGLEVLSLFFKCLRSDDQEHIKYTVSATYEEQKDQWIPDVSWLTSEEQRATRIFPLHGVDSAGVGMTRDAINGDEEARDRAFAFCLRHPPVMLCGSTSQIARPYYNKTGLMPYALAIIKSIEFIDTPDVGARAASDAVSSSAAISHQ